MTPDPYNCDAVLSKALLVAFCGLLPAILSLSVPEWVVVTETKQGDQPVWKVIEGGNGNLTALQNGTNVINDTLQELSKNKNGTSVYQQVESLKPHREKQGSGSVAHANNLENTDNVNTSKSPGSKRIVADFHTLCVTNDTDRICKPFIAFTNSSRIFTKCQLNNVSTGIQNVTNNTGHVECHMFYLGKAMEDFTNTFYVLLTVAMGTAITSTAVLDLMATLNRSGPGLKVLLGLIFAFAGGVQITSIISLYPDVVLNLPASEKSHISLGISSIFCFGYGTLCIVAAILLFIPTSQAQKPSPVSESKQEIPFQNFSEYPAPEVKLRYPPSEGFLAGEGDDDTEEWGYSPVVSDTKEVRFEIASFSDNETEKYPEFFMYNKETKIAEFRDNNTEQPGTSYNNPPQTNVDPKWNDDQLRTVERTQQRQHSIQLNSTVNPEEKISYDEELFGGFEHQEGILGTSLTKEIQTLLPDFLPKTDFTPDPNSTWPAPASNSLDSLLLQGSGTDSTIVSYELITDTELLSLNSTVGILTDYGLEMIIDHSNESITKLLVVEPAESVDPELGEVVDGIKSLSEVQTVNSEENCHSAERDDRNGYLNVTSENYSESGGSERTLDPGISTENRGGAVQQQDSVGYKEEQESQRVEDSNLQQDNGVELHLEIPQCKTDGENAATKTANHTMADDNDSTASISLSDT